MANTFQVALTADFYDATGAPKYADLGLGVFEGHPHIAVRSFAEHRKIIGADQLASVNGVIVLTPAATTGGSETTATNVPVLAAPNVTVSVTV